MSHEPAGRRIVMQRIRNRIIEYLEIASSFDEQRAYQSHQVCSVPNEMINQWEDWAHGDLAAYAAPVFSRKEQAALRCYQAIWLGVCRDTPTPCPTWRC